MWPNPQFPANLITFTEEIVNGKLHFLCREKGTAVRKLKFLLKSWHSRHDLHKDFYTEYFEVAKRNN